MTKSMHRYDLLAIGNLGFDIIHEVDRIPGLDETGLIVNRNIFFGGRAGNIAVIGSKLGLNVAVASIVGNDFIKSGYRVYLQKRQINIDNIKILTARECARTQVFKQADGKHIYFFQENVEEQNHGLDLSKETLEKSNVIYLTSFNSEKSIIGLMQKLKYSDNVFFGFGEEVYRKSSRFLELAIRTCSYLDMNERESEVLLEKMGFSNIENLFDVGTKLKLVCVSLGEEGSAIYTPEEKHSVPAVPPRDIACTLGAGDAYVAGLIYGIISKWGIEECGRLGSVLSSFILEKEGAQNTVADWKRISKRYTRFFGELPGQRKGSSTHAV